MVITWWMIPIGGLVGFLIYTSYCIAVGIRQGIFSEEIAQFKQEWAKFKIQSKEDWEKAKTDLKNDLVNKGNKGHNKISSCGKILGIPLVFIIIATCAIIISSLWLWVVFGFIIFIALLFGIRNLFLRVDISTRRSIFVSMPEFFMAGMLIIGIAGWILIGCAGENTESVLFSIGIILMAFPFVLIAGIFVLIIFATPLMMFLDWAFRRMMFFCFALTEDDFKDFGELWFRR